MPIFLEWRHLVGPPVPPHARGFEEAAAESQSQVLQSLHHDRAKVAEQAKGVGHDVKDRRIRLRDDVAAIGALAPAVAAAGDGDFGPSRHRLGIAHRAHDAD